MEMRKTWTMPQAVVQQFAANEYVAACGDIEHGMYKFKCDAPEGTLYYYDNNGRAQRLGSYTPCDKTHEAAMSSEFPNGFVDRNGNRQEDDGEGVVVWIERTWWGQVANAHATTKVDRDSWETAKS